jgi:hypothetical protein
MERPMEAATPAAELAAMLVSLGIADGPAAGYAAALAEDGFDTPASFGTLSLDELQDDFGFKRGHLRMVEKARDALGPVPQTQPAHLTEISTAAEAGAPTAVGIPTAVGVALPTAVGIPITTALAVALPRAADMPSAHDIGPERTIFGSMRFPVPPEARALAEALLAHGIYLKIVDLRPGADISTEVFAWIEFAHAFLAFGTSNYGEDTGNPASSCAECKYAQNLGKMTILLRMIPWDAHFEHLQARVAFGMNKLTLFWLPGTPLPPDVVEAIVHALDPESQKADDDALQRAQSAPQPPITRSAPATQQLSSASDFASSCGSSVDELLSFSSAELKELMKEQEDAGVHIGVLGRKRILTEIVRLQSSSASSPRSQLASDPDADDTEPQPEPEVEDEAEEDWEEEPDIMLIGDEEQVNMLLFLDLADLASMSRVARHWRTLISDDFFWERKYSWSSYACAPPTNITPEDGSLPEGVLSYRTAFRRRALWWSLPGLCIEVLDTYNIWSVARVLLVLDENHILIWFEGWGDEWLMWLDRRYDLARVRPCGSEVAGLGKRGPLEEETMIAKQAEAIDMILLAPSQHGTTAAYFPETNVWKVPACSPSQGVEPSCYCRGWIEDQQRPEEQRAFQRLWRDMEDPGRVVQGGAQQDSLEGFDTWSSALARNPPRDENREIPVVEDGDGIAPLAGGGAAGGGGQPPYTVVGAGVARCNGAYTLRPELRDDVQCWANESDTILLRYQLPSGNRWWYLADLHDLTSGRGDFYRTRCVCPPACLLHVRLASLAGCLPLTISQLRLRLHGLLFECFLYVCPEPVLVKRSF